MATFAYNQFRIKYILRSAKYGIMDCCICDRAYNMLHRRCQPKLNVKARTNQHRESKCVPMIGSPKFCGNDTDFSTVTPTATEKKQSRQPLGPIIPTPIQEIRVRFCVALKLLLLAFYLFDM